MNISKLNFMRKKAITFCCMESDKYQICDMIPIFMNLEMGFWQLGINPNRISTHENIVSYIKNQADRKIESYFQIFLIFHKYVNEMPVQHNNKKILADQIAGMISERFNDICDNNIFDFLSYIFVLSEVKDINLYECVTSFTNKFLIEKYRQRDDIINFLFEEGADDELFNCISELQSERGSFGNNDNLIQELLITSLMVCKMSYLMRDEAMKIDIME